MRTQGRPGEGVRKLHCKGVRGDRGHGEGKGQGAAGARVGRGSGQGQGHVGQRQGALRRAGQVPSLGGKSTRGALGKDALKKQQ